MALFGLFGGGAPAAAPIPNPAKLGLLETLDAIFSEGSIGDNIHEKRQAKRNAADAALLATPNLGTVTTGAAAPAAPDGREWLAGPAAPLTVPALAGAASAKALPGATYNAPAARNFSNPLYSLADRADLSPAQKLAFLMSPSKFGEALASHSAAYTLGSGDERTFGQGGPTDRNEKVVTGMHDGTPYAVRENGTVLSGKALDPTFKELTDRAQATRPVVLNKGDLLSDLTGRTLAAAPDMKEVDPTKDLYVSPGYSPGIAGAPGPAPGGSAPRGVRNNNPLNVRSLPKGTWNGQTSVDDGGYAVFDTPEAGWRAADLNLQSYAKNHGINTVAGIVNRWAPAADNNNPAAYSAYVAKAVGVDPNAKLDLSDPTVRQGVLKAMATFENGRPVAPTGGTPAAAPGAAGYQLARKGTSQEEDSLNEDTVDYVAQQYMLTGSLPPLGMGKAGTRNRDRILNRAAAIEKETGATGADAVSRHMTVKSAQQSLNGISKTLSMVNASEGTVDKNMDVVLELAKKGVGTNVPLLNVPIQSIRQRLGSADTAAFNAAIGTVADEYAKVMTTNTGTGGGVTSDAARREAYNRLNKNMSVGQLQSVITTMRREMANRTASLRGEQSALHETIRTGGKSSAPHAQAPAGGPPVGTIRNGYQFKGGDPKNANNWVKK